MDYVEKIKEMMILRGQSARDFANEIGFSNVYVSKVLARKEEPSALMKAKILDRMGHDLTIELLIEMLPEKAGEILKNMNEKKYRKITDKANLKVSLKDSKDGNK